MDGEWDGINAYEPRGPFKAFHCRKERWAVMVAHRRAGKTVACVADLVLDALFSKKQDARYAYIAPQFNQAKDVAWLYVKRLTADVPGVTYNEAELRANLPNGAQVRLFGADNPDRLRGLYLDGAILDEHADMKPRVWGEVVRPMLADRQGWAAFIGTPKGHNEFYKVWTEADQDWFKLMLRGSESGLVPEVELAAMRKNMTEDQYEQEVECSFEAAILGAYYGKEMTQADRAGRICQVPYDPAIPVYTAWDIGYRDDTAIWFYQMVRGEIHLIDFHASSGNNIKFYIDLLASKAYKYKRHWLPHDARAKTLASGGKSVIEQLAEGLDIKTMAIAPHLDIQDGIQAARMTLPVCWFDEERCFDGLEALKQYQREWDEDKKSFRERPRHDWTSHPADAFRMLSVAWRDEFKEEEKKAPKFLDIKDTPLNELWALEKPRTERRI